MSIENSKYIPDWNALHAQASEIQQFLSTLRENMLGAWGGTALYNEEQFKLEPRSNWFSHHIGQRFVNVLNPKAVFDETHKGFTTLLLKIQSLKKSIDLFDPVSDKDCPKEAQLLLKKLVDTEVKTVKNISEKGLERLCTNYEYQSKSEEAIQLRALGSAAFQEIAQAKERLANKLRAHLPDIDKDMSLAAYHLKAAGILGRRNDNLSHLKLIKWEEGKGLVVPVSVIMDRQSDQQERQTTTKQAITTAMYTIQYSRDAAGIGVKHGAADWVALRPFVNDLGKIQVGPAGVTGLSERPNTPDAKNLANLYSLIDFHHGHLLLSCGAIDSSLKVTQLFKCLYDTLKRLPSAKERYVIHELDSLLYEGRFVAATQASALTLNTLLEKQPGYVGKPAPHVLHMNTSFNAASSQEEDEKLFRQFTQESYAWLIGYIIEVTNAWIQLDEAGEEPSVLFKVLPEGSGTDLECLSKFRQLQSSYESLKNTLEGIKAEKNKVITSNDTLLQSVNVEMTSESAFFQEFALRWTVQDSPFKSQTLCDLQDSLEASFAELKKGTQSAADYLASLEGMTPLVTAQLKRSALLLKIMDKILDFQLKGGGTSSFSRCTELELHFLLYKLLKLQVVITSKNGLDKSGAACALFQAMSHFESKFYQRHLKGEEKVKTDDNVLKIIGLDCEFIVHEEEEESSDELTTLQESKEAFLESLDKEPGAEFIACANASQAVFDLIIDQDGCREELFKLYNRVICNNRLEPYIVRDLDQWNNRQTSQNNPRDLLIKAISAIEDPARRGKLTQALEYQEVFAENLLSSETIKTLFGTGVAGLKYNQDHSYRVSRYANQHPLDRLPMFLFVKTGHRVFHYVPVQLIHYREGGRMFARSCTLTEAGKAIILGLSQLRSS